MSNKRIRSMKYNNDRQLQENCIDKEKKCNNRLDRSKKGNINQIVLHYLKNNPNLYMNILTYTPLEFDIVHNMLKSDGIIIGQQKLMDLFDDQV
uniref:Structure-specific endonuclease subunit SLX4 n=1 Tax=Schistosoma haematobium TaxID=6185 RepID=A0A095A4P6_SCHHA